LESLEFDRCHIDSGNLFENLSKLRRLQFRYCKVLDTDTKPFNFLSNLPNLEYLCIDELFPLHILFGLTNLKCLILERSSHSFESLDDFKNLINLVVLKVRINADQINGDTFKDFNKLQVLDITFEEGDWTRFERGNWFKHLTNLKELSLCDYGSNYELIDFFPSVSLALRNLTQLEKLELKFSCNMIELKDDLFNCFEGLKSLFLRGRIFRFEKNSLRGLDKLIEITMYNSPPFVDGGETNDEVDLSIFNGLVNLRNVVLNGRPFATVDPSFFIDNFPKLVQLELNYASYI
jgi:hypothetical protein